MADLSALLESSRALSANLTRRELPSVNLSLEEIEAQSRRLVSRQHGQAADNDRANYLLAQAHVDASSLANSIAHLNTSTTFSPLQPLHDTDVAGYLRHTHEQNLISIIEEGRRQTQEDFYHTIEERSRKDWENRKKRVFEELGGRVATEVRQNSELRKTMRASTSLSSSTTAISSNLHMQSKILAYDQAISELNRERLKKTFCPLVHSLMNISQDLATNRSLQIPQIFHTLSKITGEPPSPPPVEHVTAHVLNAPVVERKYANAYLSDPDSSQSIELRKRITNGSKQALEEQYWEIMDRTIQARPADAKLGGDPSVANRVRAFLLLRYYHNGEWEERIELVASQPLWAKIFYLVRTGHPQEALKEALLHQQALEHREPSFLAYFKTWIQSQDGRLPRAHRDQLQSTYNTHMLNSSTADPFKLALFRLMGKLDPSRRSIPLVTSTTEDWLWFQLAMVDEEESGGLRGLAEVLMSYGERHFDGPQNQKRVGMWANVLLICGEFERAVAALDDNPDTKVEAVHLAIALAYHGLLRVPSKAESSDYDILCLPPLVTRPALNLATLIRRYVRPFMKHDAQHALHYVACICLTADQGEGVGKEQVEISWSEIRKVVAFAEGAGWDELVGGLRPDGTRLAGTIEQIGPLFMLKDENDYYDKIVRVTAAICEREGRTLEAIKLYNIAGAYDIVVACLAQALGNYLSQPNGGGDEGKKFENTAREIYHHYSRLNRAAGKERDAVYIILRIREAMAMKAASRLDAALEAIEVTNLVPLDGNTTKLNKRASEFETTYHDSVKKNLPFYLTLTMEILSEMHSNVKTSSFGEASRKLTLDTIRTKSRSILMFAGMLRFRMLPDVYSYLARLDVEIAL